MNRNRHALGQTWTRGWTVDFSIVVISMLVFVLAICAGRAGIASAADPATYTVDTYRNWLTQYANAKPDFKTGDVLTAKDLERMRPLVPPGYLEQLNFPNFKAQVIDVIPHTPASTYLRCTEQYASQVKLRADGAIMNYTCGQPFPNEGLSPSDPLSGFKAAWNYTYRYLYFGFYDLSVDTGLIRLGYDIGWGCYELRSCGPAARALCFRPAGVEDALSDRSRGEKRLRRRRTHRTLLDPVLRSRSIFSSRRPGR